MLFYLLVVGGGLGGFAAIYWNLRGEKAFGWTATVVGIVLFTSAAVVSGAIP